MATTKITREQRNEVQKLLDDVGQNEGAQGIQSIAERGYRGDVPAALVALFDDEADARSWIRHGAYEIYRTVEETGA